MESFDAAVVGAGILGLAHAYHLARRGLKVVVFERGPRALQASVRNFGMIWPIGQAPGDPAALARRSATIWRDVLEAAGLWYASSGSLHLAYHEDEAAVLTEFARDAPAIGYPNVSLLDAGAIIKLSNAVEPRNLVAGIYSTTELNVDPRQVIARLPEFLTREFGVQFVWNTTVTAYDAPAIRSGSGQWNADRLIVCAGADLQTLYPEVLGRHGLRPCKLQMLRAACPSSDYNLGPMLAAGLTLQHYAAFSHCKSLPALKARFAEQMPDYIRWGIHVMVSQTSEGELTIGDSHIYGPGAYEPFDRDDIETLILDYLDTYLCLPGERRITERWNGLYMKHPEKAYVIDQPEPTVTCVTGVGGAGMTLSFGLAEQVVKEAFG